MGKSIEDKILNIGNDIEMTLKSVFENINMIIETVRENVSELTQSAEEYEALMEDENNADKLAQLGWTYSSAVARFRYEDEEDMNNMIMDDFKAQEYFTLLEMIEAVKSYNFNQRNSDLIDEIITAQKSGLNLIIIPSLLYLFECELRGLLNQKGSRNKIMFKALDDFIEKEKYIFKLNQLNSLKTYLNNLYKFIPFEKIKEHEFNRNLIFHGVLSSDSWEEVDVYKMCNAIITILEIKDNQ